ncbi:MAG: helicase-associated domain-containing protein [Caldilineaceae bacterium]|nr:helicase-associated domain-containing protein [Caldilinea sp.]MCB9113664.1 helicase-associated domain-containing protein [Caldilineaceae bacterium]MCB9121520.1 helicase-associated domain-containing protein [Caldilineaceae bacterium]
MYSVEQLSVDEILDSYSVHALAKIAVACGLIPEQKKRPLKDDLVALMKRSLFVAENVRARYAALDSRDRTVVDYLLYHGGVLRRARLERDLVRAGLAESTRMITSKRRDDTPLYAPGERMADPTSTQNIFQDILARLTLKGLVFTVEEYSEYGMATNAYKLGLHPAMLAYIPKVVSLHLHEVSVSPLTIQTKTVAHTLHSSPHGQLRDMFLYWDFVRRVQPPFLQTGFLGKRTLRAINGQLLVPDPTLEKVSSENETGKLFALRTLLTQLKLLRRDAGKLVVAGDASTGPPAFWTYDAHRQIGLALQVIIENLRPEPSYGYGRSWQIDYQAGLKALLQRLAQGGDWEDVESVVDDLRGDRSSFLVPELASYTGSKHYISIYFGNRYYTSYNDLVVAIHTAEESFVVESCGGPLLEMGITELGFLNEKDARWRVMRLTPFGREVLAGITAIGGKHQGAQTAMREAPAPAVDQGRVVIQPNFQVLALGPVSTAILARLELCAARTKADAHVFEYTLTRESLYQAGQTGFEADAVLRFLEEISGAPLPQNVARSLQEWGAHHDRIVFRTGVSLLQSVDAETLSALLADVAAGEYLARAVAPTVALVAHGADEALLSALFAGGQLPAVTDPAVSTTDNDVIVQPDATIAPVHSVPSLFLTGRIARIAEQDAQGVWRLTPASVRRNGAGRAQIAPLLTELESLHRGALPESVVAEIKRWSNYHGRATLATVTLVEFESKEQRAELLEHPQLRDRLTPFAAGDRALALVDTAHVAAVEQLLADLGATISHTLQPGG